jgi:3-phenylpropionate/trans-cinnamate dioxygenase ferredoxin reductase subunit
VTDRVVVAGGGHAGGTLVAQLRQDGFDGEIVLFGAERDLPYHRPPLSKKFGDSDPAQWLRDPDFYPEQAITVFLGEQVESIDRASKKVTTNTGRVTGYDVLVLATGAEPRRLPVPGGDLGGVLTLRTLDDARAVGETVTRGGRIAIIGGGYVGLEVAAAARAHGAEVTVLEREDRVLARVASPRLSEILAAYHEARGTEIITGVDVTGLTGNDGHVTGVSLAGDTRVTCNLVLVGIGAVPRDELATAAGLTCDGGVVVDEHARTGDSSILAIGDVTRRPLPGSDRLVRLESIPSAVEQARQASATITGSGAVAAEVPWFWSDQFDLKLKIAGVLGGRTETVLRGDPGAGKFALFHHEDGLLTTVEAANSPAEFMAGRKFMAGAKRIDPVRLADPTTALRDAVVH